MKTWAKATIMAAIAICVSVGTALATILWQGSTAVNDEMFTYGGNDHLNLGGDNDLIHMGTGIDTITFHDGDAKLTFHTGGTGDLGPAAPMYMQYKEGDEDLVVYAADDFIIQLGE